MIAGTRCAGLVGWQAELAAGRRALDIEAEPWRRVALLAGEAGIGKTRLARELAAGARASGRAVLWGGCSEAGSRLPLLPFNEAIGNHLAGADLEPLRAALGALAAPLGRLVPGFGADPGPADLRLYEAVLLLLRVLAEGRGLVLFIDDLHVADGETLGLLDFLARRVGGQAIRIVAIYRTDAVRRRHRLVTLLNGWARASLAEAIELRPLDRDDVRREGAEWRLPAPDAGERRLSERERELLALLAGGATDKEIAAGLGVAVSTVRTHLDRIRDKTGRRRRSELTRLALELGLLPQR